MFPDFFWHYYDGKFCYFQHDFTKFDANDPGMGIENKIGELQWSTSWLMLFQAKKQMSLGDTRINHHCPFRRLCDTSQCTISQVDGTCKGLCPLVEAARSTLIECGLVSPVRPSPLFIAWAPHLEGAWLETGISLVIIFINGQESCSTQMIRVCDLKTCIKRFRKPAHNRVM